MVAGIAAFVVVLLSAYGDGRQGMDLVVNSLVVGVIVFAVVWVLVRRRRR
jgi:hypothetical protein